MLLDRAEHQLGAISYPETADVSVVEHGVGSNALRGLCVYVERDGFDSGSARRAAVSASQG